MEHLVGLTRCSTRVPCNLCGGSEFKDLHRKLVGLTGYSMARCRHCGLVQQNPRQPVDVETAYYRYGYYESDHKAKEHLSRLRMFRSYLSRIQRFCPRGCILDIGCGPAHFLRFAHGQGFDVFGVEVSESAVRAAVKHLPGKVILGTVAEAKLPQGHFDVATLFNVLDQLPQPLETAAKVFDLLKPGGFLLARVPNGSVHDPFKRLLNGLGGLTKRAGLEDLTPFHLYQFTPHTLGRLYRKAGFKKVKMENSPLSRGDPSGRSRGVRLASLVAAKHGYGYLARLMSRATGGQVLLGSSLDGYAFKDG